MVLWEITLGTAYFLGLKRTYRLALKIQRRLISPKHSKTRKFVHGRTRAVFDVALKVHQNIQQRDIEVGRNFGNWILRWLDRMKPSAQIRGHPTGQSPNGGITNMNADMSKKLSNSSYQNTPGGFRRFRTNGDHESGRHLFASSRNMWPKPFPAIATMMRPAKTAGSMIQHRYLSTAGPEAWTVSPGRGGFEGVIRKDIMQWMLHN